MLYDVPRQESEVPNSSTRCQQNKLVNSNPLDDFVIILDLENVLLVFNIRKSVFILTVVETDVYYRSVLLYGFTNIAEN